MTDIKQTTTPLPPPANANIPHRFREKAFRRYEQLIGQIVNSFPSICTFKPSQFNLSPVTFSCRLRDAIKSWEQNHWPTTAFTQAAFDRARLAGIMVSESPESSIVYAGGKDAMRGTITNFKPLASSAPVANAAAALPPLKIDATHPNDKHLLCKLAEYRALACELHVTGLSADDVVQLQQQYDVSIEPTATAGVMSIL